GNKKAAYTATLDALNGGDPVDPTPDPTPTTPQPTGGTGACKVVYAAPSQWQSGFTANVRITNNGPAVNGWTLSWTFPGNQTVTNAWNAVVTQNGTQVTAKNAAYNPQIPAGGTVEIGFNGSFSGSNPAPTSFTLNGAACTG
ncbi:cellulose-binding domain-containing protein, partial [Cellulomonas cellasea]